MAEPAGDSYSNPVYGVTVEGVVVEEESATSKPLPAVPDQRSGYDNPCYRPSEPTSPDFVTYHGDNESVYSDPSLYNRAEKTIVIPKRKAMIAFGIIVAVACILVVVILAITFKKGNERSASVQQHTVRERVMTASMTIVGGPHSVYIEQYADNQTEEFEAFSQEFAKLMSRTFSMTSASDIYDKTIVKELKPGSVVVIYELHFVGDPDTIYEHSESKVTAILLDSFRNENEKGAFEMDLSTVQVSRGPYTQKDTVPNVQCSNGNQNRVFAMFCAKVVDYTSFADRPFLGSESGEFFKEIEKYLTPSVMLQMSSISQECKRLVVPFICHVVFPKCDNGKRVPLCEQTCRNLYAKCPVLGALMSEQACLALPSKPETTACYNMPKPQPFCNSTEFLCMAGPAVSGMSKCIPASKRCDRVNDCSGGEDEISCAPTPAPTLQCSSSKVFETYCSPFVTYNTTIDLTSFPVDQLRIVSPVLAEMAAIQSPTYLTFVFEMLKKLDATGMSHLVSDECRNHIMPFYCLLAFPRCETVPGPSLPIFTYPCQSYCRTMFQICSTIAYEHFSPSECDYFATAPCMGKVNDPHGCGSNQILCRNGPILTHNSTCIAAERRCNGQRECLDNSDEQNCPTLPSCPNGYTPCIGGTAIQPVPNLHAACIPVNRRCNSVNDCLQGSDEKGCSVTPCASNQFQCTHGYDMNTENKCINITHQCDGTIQCSDRSDEKDCQVRHCLSSEFRCVTGVDKYNLSSCILSVYRCDGNDDCRDGSDEQNCPSDTCNSDQFKCVTGLQTRFATGGRCIPMANKCDGLLDCADGSDEKGCTSCPDGGFRCKTGGQRVPLQDRLCVPAHGKCNGVVQCEDHSDENEDCGPTNCTAAEFQCTNGYYIAPGGGKCIPSEYRCDRKQDCSDSSDETGCTYTCRSDQWMCTTDTLVKPPYRGFCTNSTQKCDGHVNCKDGSDEANCNPNCTHDELSCGALHGQYTRACIYIMEECDGLRDCADGRDESPDRCDDCSGHRLRCRAGRFLNDQSQYCYTYEQRCDGTQECHDNSDESECGSDPPSCRVSGRFKCLNGFSAVNGDRCIHEREVCDAVDTCTDGSDELNCVYRCNTTTEFQCQTGSVTYPPYTGYCILKQSVCDGHFDCADGSDERDCENTTCAAGHQRCPSGHLNATDVHNGDFCIETDWLCDGTADCTDLSDEQLPQCNLNENGCQAGQFRCNGTLIRYPFIGYCINVTEVCDGYIDCQHGDDEPSDCSQRPCPTDQPFRCGTNADGTAALDKHNGDACIPYAWVCDGEADCTNFKDEQGCGGLT